jgi:hypothetical protein
MCGKWMCVLIMVVMCSAANGQQVDEVVVPTPFVGAPPVLLAPSVYAAPVMVAPPVYAPPVMIRPPVYGYPYVTRTRYWTPLRDFLFGTHRVHYVPYVVPDQGVRP